MATTLEQHVNQVLPNSLKALQDNGRSLAKLAVEYRELNESNNGKPKQQALEETKEAAFQALASVAYQVNVLANNINSLIELQLGELEGHFADVRAISQQISASHEYVGRRAVGDMEAQSTPIIPARTVKLAESTFSVEDRSSARLDFSSLDHIGIGRERSSSSASSMTKPTSSPSAIPANVAAETNLNRAPSAGGSILSFKNRNITQKPTVPVAAVVQSPRLPSSSSLASTPSLPENLPPPPSPAAAMALYADIPPPPPAVDLDLPPPPPNMGAPSSSSVIAMYDYAAQTDEEISISAGEILLVTNPDMGDGWMEGQNGSGKKGLFPQSYVEYM